MLVYHADLAQAQADPALAALFGAGGTPFDRLDWLRLMAEECLAPARCTIAVAREGDALAALPLRHARDGYAALANWYSFVARPRWNDADAAPALLAGIVRALGTDGALRLAPLPEAEARAMHTAARMAGWWAHGEAADVNHVLPVRGRAFADYWAARPGPLRETVRRKRGRVETRIADRFNAADWAAFEAIYAQSWKPAEGCPAFLRRFAEAEGAAGRLRLGLATIAGAPVAAQFWTIEAGTAYIHKLAHRDDAAAHSPGTLLSHALFAHAFAAGAQLIDFGTGDDRYKRDWMETTRTRYRVSAFHPARVHRWGALARMLVRKRRSGDALAATPAAR